MLWGNEYFQILHGKQRTVGELTPTGTMPLQRHLAMKRVDKSNSEVATSDMTGFLGMAVTVAGPTYEDMNFEVDIVAKAGQKVSLLVLEDGGEFEVEGELAKGPDDDQDGLLITSGTGAITAGTAADVLLSVYKGRWREAQSGDKILGIVRKAGLTPLAAATNIRILAEYRMSGNVKP